MDAVYVRVIPYPHLLRRRVLSPYVSHVKLISVVSADLGEGSFFGMEFYEDATAHEVNMDSVLPKKAGYDSGVSLVLSLPGLKKYGCSAGVSSGVRLAYNIVRKAIEITLKRAASRFDLPLEAEFKVPKKVMGIVSRAVREEIFSDDMNVIVVFDPVDNRDTFQPIDVEIRIVHPLSRNLPIGRILSEEFVRPGFLGIRDLEQSIGLSKARMLLSNGCVSLSDHDLKWISKITKVPVHFWRGLYKNTCVQA